MEFQNRYNVGSIFAYYASITAFLTLVRQFYYQFIPAKIRQYIDEKISEWFSKQKILDPKIFTLVINQYHEEDYGPRYSCNDMYNASETYLSNKLRSLSTRLRGYRVSEGPVSYQLAQGEEYTEYVTLDEDNKNVRLHWKFSSKNNKGEESDFGLKKSFELSFEPKYKDAVLDHYIPSVVVKNYDKCIEMNKEIYLYSYNSMSSRDWCRVTFNHPFTFDTLALDPELKKSIVDDIDRFLRRRDFYKKIGKAWKRGYLLYGPPGTGKSSLIAAIANYLKFSVYDLQLSSIQQDSTLRNLMMSITNKSILVIEDIDCASGLSRNVALSRERCDDNGYTYSDDDYGSGDRYDEGHHVDHNNHGGALAPTDSSDKIELSLSGLLNFIDGLWSSCGDERIIILTTNYKDRLDPALLRPGRMDMHIHMSYLKMPGFRVLASNYLDLTDHPLFEEIEELLNTTDVSPAEAAEELIRSEVPDVALKGVLNMLKQKRGRKNVIKGKEATVGDEHEPLSENRKDDCESISDTEKM